MTTKKMTKKCPGTLGNKDNTFLGANPALSVLRCPRKTLRINGILGGTGQCALKQNGL